MTDDYIEELKERDKAKPLKKLLWAVGKDPLPICPNCGEILVLVKRDNFCRTCGQRLMKDVWEL